jgi:pimeloyl-ACP methyl ester carboxylesterase
VNRYLFETKQAWRKQGFSAVESSRTGQTLKYATGFLEDVEGWGREGDVPTFLNRLKVPLFLVHGSEDKSVSPEESESLAAIYPQAQLAILSGADHKFNAAHPFKEASAPLIQAFNITAAFFRNESHRSA